MAEDQNSNQPVDFQPGQVVSPGEVPPAPAAPVASATPVVSPPPVETPAPVVADTPPPPDFQQPAERNQNFDTDEYAQGTPEGQTISWTASEFIAHEKTSQWYALLAIAAVALAVLVYFLNHHDVISSGVVLLGGVVLGIYGARKPRELDYQISPQGLQIDRKYYGFDQFRSFSVVPEGAFSSIMFMPLKRFAPTTSIYYAPEDEEQIVDLLSRSLPMSKEGFDVVDRLMRRIRF